MDIKTTYYTIINNGMRPFIISSLLIILLSCSMDSDFSRCLSNDAHNRSQTVSLEEVTILAKAISRGDKARSCSSEAKLPKVIPIIDIYKDTIFFAVDFYPGWKLISSDKRTPAVLAENKTGCFLEACDSEGFSNWLEIMAEDLRSVKKSPDWRLQEDEYEESSTSGVWKSLIPSNSKSRFGHYELYETQIIPLDTVTVNHLTPAWHQHYPFNSFCPLKSNNSGDRAPAGCVAVAGAQMLAYLHNKIGRPVSSPSTGYCIGQVGNYSQNFSDFTAEAIDNIYNYNSNDYAALLTGFVGMAVNTDYDNDGSGAQTEDLVDNVFESFGIGCNYGSYSESRLRTSLLDSIPVIVRADGKKRTIFGIPTYSYSHSFIIDGYKSNREKVLKKYVWCDYVENPDSLGTYMPIPDYSNFYIDSTYTSPIISKIQMNWGWGAGSTSYNTWFTTTGNWKTPEISNDCNFIYRREMIYNFHAL